MKKSQFTILMPALGSIAALVLAQSVSASVGPRASDERLEIPVEVAFAPSVGFDDNDNVQSVLHGVLPNACYTLAEAKAEVRPGGNTIALHQYAVRSVDGICAEGAQLPPHMDMAIPFTKEVDVGRLQAGDYDLAYTTYGSRDKKRALNVGVAPTVTVDSLPYAGITNVHTDDLVAPATEIKAVLKGVLNSSCTSLDEYVRIEKEGDVFVVLPTIKVEKGVLCMQLLIPFEREITLGRAAPGKYLIHTRSQNGRAVNRVIEVVATL